MRTNLGIAVEMGEVARGAQIKRGTTETETVKTPEPGSMPERKLKPERSRPGRRCAQRTPTGARELGALLLMKAVIEGLGKITGRCATPWRRASAPTSYCRTGWATRCRGATGWSSPRA